jgi:hypothetical protein
MSALKSTKLVSRKYRSSQNHLTRKSSTVFYRALFVVLTVLVGTSAWGQGKVLYSFTGLADGNAPTGGLIRDAAGNLFGATPGGGDRQPQQCQTNIVGCGVVFELSPNSDGTWKQTVIHTFTPGTDGIVPFGSLVMDSAGNLYGTTTEGGTGCTGFYGCGTVYELSPQGGGVWTETILYNFKAGTDGEDPEAGLVIDTAGNLYGTTRFGANSACNGLGCGTVFELTPGSGGSWTYQILYIFQDGADGAEPGSELTFDKAGNLYGSAAIGGDVACNPSFGCGVIYKLSPSSSGWTESAIHTFDCDKGGCFPGSGVAVDSLGNIYGNMSGAGLNAYGFVFKLIPQTGGTYQFSFVYSFDLVHGGQPYGAPTVAGGSVYGTASSGGGKNASCTSGCGGVFRLTHGSSGLNYTFLGFGTAPKGSTPKDNLILDSAGNLYGTTSAGGASGAGTVFEITQ